LGGISLDNREDIGKRIKELRQYFGITQLELCQGICTQAYISKVENGAISISADLLFQIAERLGIDINYLFNSSNNQRLDYIEEVIIQARELVDKQKYEELSSLIKLELKSPLLFNRKFKQFILWHYAISERHLHKDYDKALDLIDQALSLSFTTDKNYSERESEILLTKANILLDLKQFKNALHIYKKIYNILSSLPLIIDKKLKARLYYNWARSLYLIHEYNESLNIVNKGILYCRENQLMYGLGQLYFLQGQCNIKINKEIEAIKSLKYAYNIFELSNHLNHLDKTIKQLEKLKYKTTV
jgi:transcriptional regulator with XRE-family HTH domain